MANDLIVNIDADTSDLESGIADIKQNLAIVSQSLIEFGAKIAEAFSGIMDATFGAQEAMSKFENQTGSTAKATAKYGSAMKDIYKNGLGESLADVSDAMAKVEQQSGLLGTNGVKDVKQLTKSALILQETFEFEVAESVRSAGAMMKNFGIDGKTAYNLIAKGAQEGLNKSDDLLDTLNEYSPLFSGIGFSASDMFEILKAGSESGAFTVDKVADSIKEFSIRVKDGSTGTADAFKEINMNAEEMGMRFAKGGEDGKKAFFEVMTAIKNIEDPIKQNSVGVALFGTMFEDLGSKGITALANLDGSFKNVEGTVEKINKISMKDFSKQWEEIKRTIETDVLVPLGTSLIPALKEVGKIAKEYLPMIGDAIKDSNPKIITAITAIAGLITLLLPLIGIIGTLIPAFEAVGAVLASIGGAIGGFFSAPVVAVIALIGIWIAVIIKFKDEIMKTFNTIANTVMPIITTAFNYMKGVFIETFKPIIDNELPKLKESFMTAFTSVQTNLATVLPLIKDLIMGLAPVFWFIIGTLKIIFDNFVMILGNIVSFLTVVLSEVMIIISSVLNIIIGIVNVVLGVLSGDWERIWTGIKQILSAIWEAIKSIITVAFSAIYNIVSSFLGIIFNIFSAIFPNMANTVSGWMNNIKNIFYDSWNSIRDSVSNLASSLPGTIRNIGHSMYNAGANLIDQLIAGIRSSVQALKNTCSSVASSISNFFPHSPAKEGALRTFPKVGVELMNQLMDGMEAQKNNVYDVVGNITAGISSNISTNYSTGNSNNNNVTIPIYLDGNKITQVVAPKMTKLIRQQGGY